MGNPAWRQVRRYGSGFDAGWMGEDEAGLPGLGENDTEEPPAVV